MLTRILTDAWFWAFLAAVGWGICFGIVGARTLGRTFDSGSRPSCLPNFPACCCPSIRLPTSPELEPGHAQHGGRGYPGGQPGLWHPGLPDYSPHPARPSRPPAHGWAVSLVRHPLMLCDILWPLGWSLIYASLIGVLLTPLWLLIIWVLTNVEEEALVQEYGDAYRAFQARVPRLFPRLPGFNKKRSIDKSQKHLTAPPKIL